MQAGHQLRLGVLPILKMQPTQCSCFLAESLFDLSNREVYRLVVWHCKISSEVFKGRGCEYYTEKLTLDDLAEKFFINKFYLSKIFKETYGTTVTTI